ncbi:MAG TPA: 30S ribosomal protein S6 [Thermomicrobiaceae bacterium]|nr:30S ribosomal protein S6 [Thermomicrobiaceae bacterium]
MVLIMPELADEALTAEVEQINGALTGSGAQITFLKRDTPWGRRRLAYPIGRFRDATYVLYRFNAPPGAVRAIERELQLDERVIRYLFVRQDTAPEEPETEAEQAAETAEANPEEAQAEAQVQAQPAPVEAEPAAEPPAETEPGEPS